MDMAAPLVVVGWFVALGIVGFFWGADSRDGFTEATALKPRQRWFITRR